MHTKRKRADAPEVWDVEDDGGADAADAGVGEELLGDGDGDDLCFVLIVGLKS